MSHGFQMVNKTYHLLYPVASLTIFFTSFTETNLIGCLVTFFQGRVQALETHLDAFWRDFQNKLKLVCV